jgi:hypothetical protein
MRVGYPVAWTWRMISLNPFARARGWNSLKVEDPYQIEARTFLRLWCSLYPEGAENPGPPPRLVGLTDRFDLVGNALSSCICHSQEYTREMAFRESADVGRKVESVRCTRMQLDDTVERRRNRLNERLRERINVTNPKERGLRRPA